MIKSLTKMLAPGNLVTSILGSYWNETQKSIADMMTTQAIIDPDGTMAAYDGSLVSLLTIDGAATLIGGEEEGRMLDVLAERWNNIFNQPGYAMQIVWENDPAGGYHEMQDAVDILRHGARRYQLDVDDILEERARVVGEKISSERTVLALWTRPAALTREQIKQYKKEYSAFNLLVPNRYHAQNEYVAGQDLITKHEAYVQTILHGLGEVNIGCKILNAQEAVNELNYSFNGEYFGGKTQRWDTPVQKDTRVKERGDGMESLLATPLSEQVIANEPKREGETVILGSRRYAPMDIQLGPLRVPPYHELVSRLRDQKVPVRLSLLFESDGMPAFINILNIIGSALSLSNMENAIRVDAFNELIGMRDHGIAVPRFRGSVVTWADVDKPNELRKNKSSVTQVVQGWGDMAISRVVGDPLETLVTTIPGVVCASTGQAGMCLFRDMLRMIPTTRLRSLDAHGAMSFRTPEGKHIRYRPHTDGFNCDLISGLPGQGKSVFMSALSLSSLLSSSSEELPYDATIDVGGSCEGMIKMVRDALPAHQRHMAGFFRLENNKQYACNIHDTQLGHRFPLGHEKEFLKAFYIRLLTPEDDRAVDGLSDIVDDLIEEVYQLKAGYRPDAEASLYVFGNIPDIDETLKKYGKSHHTPKTTWWEIVDRLFELKEYHLAGFAQRYAVPTMRDMASALNRDQLREKARKVQYSATENLEDATRRLLSSNISRFPILANATNFDISDTRIIGIDVGAIAPQDDSPSAKKQTALMFMLARFVATRSWWIPIESLRQIPEHLQGYHNPRISRMLEVQKTLKYDEAHRASGMWDSILLAIRETRKNHFHVVLGSQLPTDYPETIRTMANRHWLMSAGIQEEETRKIASIYGFSDVIRHRARTGLHKPDRRGAPFLTLIQSDSGFYTLHLYLSLGAMELWSYSTEPKDASFRRRLEDRVSSREARQLLAKHYPAASILKPLAERVKYYEEQGYVSKANESFVMNEMIEKMISDNRRDAA